jgi:3-oxoadipate enol-lactonase
MGQELTVNDIAVRIDGRPGAPWVTLLHSLATHAELWTPQVAALAGRYRVLRPDFPGHGGSQGSPLARSTGALAELVLGLWRALEIERSHLVGLSLGGMTALELGLAAPGRVGALVAADCRADAPPFFRAMWDERQARVREGGLAAIVEPTLASWLTPATRSDRPDLVAGVEAMILATAPDGYLAATAALQALDIKRRLPGMAAPVRFVCGDADGVHPAEMQALAQMTPGASYVDIEGAAHLSNLEQPDRFNAALIAALDAAA